MNHKKLALTVMVLTVTQTLSAAPVRGTPPTLGANSVPEAGYPAVGYIEWINKSTGASAGIACTATIIGETTLLAAGHCTMDFAANAEYEDVYSFRFVYDLDPQDDVAPVVVPIDGGRAILFNEFQYTIEQNQVYYDIGIFKPLNGFTFDSENFPYPFPTINTRALSDSSDAGREGVLVGYGRTGVRDGTEGTKRSGTFALGYVEAYAETQTPPDGQFDSSGRMFSWSHSLGGTDSNAVHCQGDSGGPIFLKGSDNQLYLSGVVSWNTFYLCGLHGIMKEPDIGAIAHALANASADSTIKYEDMPN